MWALTKCFVGVGKVFYGFWWSVVWAVVGYYMGFVGVLCGLYWGCCMALAGYCVDFKVSLFFCKVRFVSEFLCLLSFVLIIMLIACIMCIF